MSVIQQRFCTNHPDRPAIGVCVITQKPICGECSTRYEGVNYSREGLRILQERRAAAEAAGRGSGRAKWVVLGALITPVCLYLAYLGYFISAETLINLMQWGQ